MKSVLLVKYGEICLRGGNRSLYEKKLLHDIRKRLPQGVEARKELSRFCVEAPEGMEPERLISSLSKVLGVIGISPCIRLEQYDLPALCDSGLFFMRNLKKESFSFKVHTKRANKRFPIKSQEVSAAIGEHILMNMPEARVDVHSPDIVLHVELRNHAYIYADTVKCAGGLPSGSSGKGLLLLSGGIDSPVAGFLAARRGVDITAVYFHSPPYTSERAKQKVADLAQLLSSYTGHVKLYVVPFTDVQLYLRDKIQAEKLTILLKRGMLRIAEMIAVKEGCHCLITGDSIGQVASQTLQSIHAVESAATLPILRPLAGSDKQEIIDRAKEIGTYEISIRPYEDCCTLFVAEHPETKPKTSIIEGIEARLDGYGELLQTACESTEIMHFDGHFSMQTPH